MKRLMQHFVRRGQTGQSIVILAFGFVVLLGFVGIVTDVSLLFVRYSTLRRAIDSAAVAAAGQMRRILPIQQDYQDAAAAVGRGETTVTADGIAYARNLATVNLAARQFIEFYGINPTNIVVETCLSTNGTDAELCTADQRKLVRVTAQMQSPTVFLRLLGWGNVTLEASAISETAVLDVVLIMDVSESMLEATSHEDWAAIPQPDGSFLDQSARIVPPSMDAAIATWVAADPVNNTPVNLWMSVLNMTHPTLMTNPLFTGQPNAFKAFVRNGNSYTAASASQMPRKTCQVRFWPSGARAIPNGASNGYAPADDLLTEIRAYLNDPAFPSRFSNFVLGYNFYGCCNDPNGDGDFSDLICQPFKQARDASLDFIKQVDFARGDRVAVVTFDRSATLIYPEHQAGTDVSHMIDDETTAVNIIRKAVGVRAEESFYADRNNDGLWDSYSVDFGSDFVGFPGTDKTANYGGRWDTGSVGMMADYPVYSNCPFQNAALSYPYSLYSSQTATDVPTRFPNSLAALVNPIMNPNLHNPGWEAVIPNVNQKPNYTYELRASCSGTNMGAALREANNALLNPDTVRTNGAVWVMVMLSDGAAGASDPANKASKDAEKKSLGLPLVYESTAYTAVGVPNTGGVPPLPGEYGVFGVCPIGTTGKPSELIKDEDAGFPYCGDLLPETRHFCFDPRDKSRLDGSIYLNLENPNCDVNYYDVDDFARDWADYVGLLDPYPALRIGTGDRSDLQLPTIFTIGFNLTFNEATERCKEGSVYFDAASRQGDNENCLGEELLRYIADVGDNFQVDTDYQQDWRNDRLANLTLDAGDEWGVRGPCEDPIPGFNSPADVKAAGLPFSTIIYPKPAGESCGNYFNATNGVELQQVFDEIAARMFTRLAR